MWDSRQHDLATPKRRRSERSREVWRGKADVMPASRGRCRKLGAGLAMGLVTAHAFTFNAGSNVGSAGVKPRGALLPLVSQLDTSGCGQASGVPRHDTWRPPVGEVGIQVGAPEKQTPLRCHETLEEKKHSRRVIMSKGPARGAGGTFGAWFSKSRGIFATTGPGNQAGSTRGATLAWLGMGPAGGQDMGGPDGGGGPGDGWHGGWYDGSYARRRGDGGGVDAVTNSTGPSKLVSSSRTSGGSLGGSLPLELDSGVEVDKVLVKRSPLIRTLGPVFDFFRSRAGLYSLMLGYVMVTLSQHITPALLGMSFITAVGPRRSRPLVVALTQGLSLLTVASYIQDQFRHQVYPLPAVVAGPDAPYAVITGGSSGIGRAVADELAARGYNLLLVARGKDSLKRAAKEIRRTSRETAERARKQIEEGESYSPETRRQKRKRLQRERDEMRRRVDDRYSDDDDDYDAGLEVDKRDAVAQGSLTVTKQDGEHAGGTQPGADDLAPSSLAPAPSHITEPVRVRWFQADLANASEVTGLYDEVSRLNLSVDILVNAAGVARTGRLEHSTSQDVEGQINLNVLGTTLLTRLFAQDFAKRRRGRIMVVSSITAAAPNPRVSVYAATKSYLTSFAEALHSEMEVWGVGVTCLMPGATRTNFEANSGSANALIWRLPFFVHEAHEVASKGVEAMMRGDRLVVPGWLYKMYVHVMAPLFPPKITMTCVEAFWR